MEAGTSMRSYMIAGLIVWMVAGCTTERTFEMSWALTNKGLCGAPGNEGMAGEREVTLRYVVAPNHYMVFCSNKLASALQAGGDAVVPAVIRRNRLDASYSICAIAGMKDDAPGADCTFGGFSLGGFESSARPSPWE
jgi:hypothetical protein